MEPPQRLADATTSSGVGRPRFLGRFAINSTTKKLSSHPVKLQISSEVNKKINRKSRESLLIQHNGTKPVEKNKEQQHKRENVGNISFNASTASSVFEDIDYNVPFWNPLPTPFAGHCAVEEEKKDLSASVKTRSSAKDENRDNVACMVVDHEIPERRQNSSASMTNIETVSMNSKQTDAIGDDEKLLLSSWGIPEAVLKKYNSFGIQKMFQWQAECLLVGNVLAGSNLVYSAPTSAGKTMVAELLILKRVLETKRKAIMILPFVSVAHEKVRYLKSLYEELGVHVGGFLGSQSPVGGFKSVDVAVCTIEKGNNLVNRLIEENELHQLGIIVVDELHMVGDSSRGYLLELLLTKILFIMKCNIAKKSKSNQDNELPSIQIIGMSATLPNLPVVAKWLNASLYKTEFRPVPLYECVKINRSIFDSQMKKLRDIDVQNSAKNDTEHVIPLCLETVFNGDGVLVFCPTKMWCEKLADTVAREFFNFLHKNGIANVKKNDLGQNCKTLPINKEAAFDVVEQLKRCPAGLDGILQKTIQCGVAFHHAGLTFDEREIVESAFRKGIIKVLIATSTLSSGVNLPARRVIIRTIMFHGKVINTRTYKQMVGRAGRKGVDIEGESILVCKMNEKKQAGILMQSSLPAVVSTLLRHPDDHLSTSMKRAILEIIVSGAARKPSDVYLYTKCTLLSACLEEEKEGERVSTNDIDPVQECIEFLKESEFITLKKVPNTDNEESESCFFPTQLGSAVLSSGLSPDEGIYVFLELQRARRCFVLENELHVLYLVTPIYSQDISANIDWFSFYNVWEKLSTDQKRVAELVGVEESFLVKAMHGRIPTKTDKQMRMLSIHKRFYASLALLDLAQEMSIMAVSKKYKCNKGQVQSLQQSAATFAGMVTTFCARLGWTLLELIISQFQSRLTFGVQRELCDLVRISLLSGQQARMLFSAGYVSVASLAKADPDLLEHILRTGTSFQSDKKTEDETEWEAKERLANRHCIWLRGMPGMTAYEAALAIIEEAQQTIEHGLGGVGLKWEEQENVSITNKSATVSFNKKNSSIHRHQSNFTKFLKNNSQKKNSNETDKTTANDSPKDSQLNTQQKSVILSPPPGFANKSNSKVSGNQISDTKVCQAGTTISDERDNSSDSKRHSNNMQSEEKTDIYGENFRLKSDRDRESAACEDMDPESVSKIIPSENKSTPVESKSNLNKEVSTSNAKLLENQSSVGKKTIGKRKASSECDREPSTNAPLQVLQNKEFSTDDQKAKNLPSTSTSAAGAVVGTTSAKNERHVKFSPAQMPKSEALTPTTHSEALKLFTTSTPIDDEQLTLDNPTFVTHDRQEVNEDTCCTPVNNGKFKSAKPTDAGSSIAWNIQPKQLISASPSCSNDYNSHKQMECIEDGRKIIKSNGAVDNHENGNQRDDSIILEMPEIHKMAVDPKPGSSGSDGPVLTPERCRDNSKDNDNVAEISTMSDVFADSFVMDTQVADLMGASKLDVRDDSCTRHVPEKNLPQQEGDLPASETSPVLFIEDPVVVDEVVAASKTETRNHNFAQKDLPIDDHGRNHPDKVFSNGQQLSDAEESPSDLMMDTEEELLPASNYERFAYGDDLHNSLVEENDLFNSYDELRIPYESGQEAVFVLNANTKQEQLETEENRRLEDKPDCNLNLSNDDLFTPLPVDIGISMMERQDKDSQNFDEFLKPMSLEMKTQTEAQANTKVESDQSHKELRYGNTERGIATKEPTNLVKISEKRWQEADSLFITQSGSRKRKQTFSCPNEEPVRTKAKKSAHLSKEKEGSPSVVETNLSTGSDCFPPTPDSLFSESLQLSAIATPQLFGKSSQRRRSPRLHNSDVDSGTQSLLGSGRQSVSKTKQASQKYCTRKRGTQLNNTGCENSGKNKEMKTPSDSVFLGEGTSSAAMSVANQATRPNVVSGNPCHFERMDSDEGDECGNLNESKPVQPLCDASQQCSQNEFTIIDVCSNRQLFDTFILEWNTKKKYALSIGCEKLPPVDPTLGIGGNFMEGRGSRVHADGLKVEEEGLLVVGIAICWNHQDSYYLSFTETNPTDDIDDSLAPPTLDSGISIAERLQSVRQILTSHNDNKRTIVAFDVKSVYSILAQTCSVAPRYHFEDPKIAAWMLDPGAKESSFQRLIYDYLPTEQDLLDGLGGGIGRSSLGLTVDNPGSGRYRATAESVLVWHLMKHLEKPLQEEGILQTFRDTEMPVVCTVSRMELNGIGFSEEECEHLKTIMQLKLSSLEEKAYALAGHPFSLSSIGDVSRVLYLELHLPVNGNPNAITPAMSRKTLGTKRGTKMNFSTSKETLEKLKSFHPLPEVILEWRRITNSLTKVVFPLQKAKVYFSPMTMHRIFGVCQLHTATGRISMFDPNLQNIPKDFNINIEGLFQETAAIPPSWLRNNSSDSFTVSMRHAFIPLPDGVMIAADYSQLELRMIAHLSQDSKLISILNLDCDVFRQIAAEWKDVSLDEVQTEERQQAKQICYGIIYGIGAKALGETLGVDENDAAVFIETFKSKYPGMKSYLRHLVEYCRDKGYIKTITGRKRYLPNITSTNQYAKAQAERQAVNSTIQGSAADLVKKAMINIEKKFLQTFPQSSMPHRVHAQASHNKDEPGRHYQQMKQKDPVNCRSGAFLLLQIHDELLYEVAKQNFDIAANIIQEGMESAMKLTVRMPVKLKRGQSWGQLDDFTPQ